MNRGILGLGLVVFLVGVAWSSYAALRNPERGPRDYNWERIQATGELVIGVDPSIPPFGEHIPDGVMGLDPALGQALAQAMGLEARFVLLSFDGLYDTLLLGYADVIIAALRLDPMRGDRVRYTDAYFDAGHVLVSRADALQLTDLRGKTLGVEFASEGDMVARQVSGLTLTRYFSATEALQGLENEEIDATLVDRISVLLFAPPDDWWVSAPLIPDPYVMAVRRQDWRLYQALEATLQGFKQDGTLAALTNEWVSSP